MVQPNAVEAALAKAAERSQRLAELESAQNSMEKLLNYALPPEQLPWGEPMSMSQRGLMNVVTETVFVETCTYMLLLGS